MKKHIRLSTKQLLFVILFALTFIAITIFLFSYRRDERRFYHITSKLFVDEMCASTLSMHYTIAYPENFGIPGYRAKLPLYSAEGTHAGCVAAKNTLAALNNINPDKLSASDRYTHTLLTRTLENALAKNKYSYYDEPLSPSCGTQSQLPILLAEYTFRNKRDIEDYLKLLSQTDEYFASLLAYEQEKKDAGLLMAYTSLQKVRKQCDTIVTKEVLEEETHFLQTTFAERLAPLYKEELITKKETQAYIAQNNRLLKTVLLPAYEALSDGLLLLEDETIAPKGLGTCPDGKDYYRHLLISETGSYRPISEITSLLTETLATEYKTIQSLAGKHPEYIPLLSSGNYTCLPYQDAATMLTDVQLRMEDDFPDLQSVGSGIPNVAVKKVSTSLEQFCAPAFYLTTPIDDTDNNVIYINEKNAPSGLELYTTLAHEGYPGHLYQNVYTNRHLLNNSDNKVRSLLWYGGYLEGWALYVEFMSFDYAAELMQEHNRPGDAVCVQLEKHNRSLQLCLYSLIDVLLHYENASTEEIAKILKPFGITDSATVDAVYTYIAENPCNYLKYYLGYLEILELKKQAATLWGSAYSDYQFHTFYLNCGPSDFTSLSEQLESFLPAEG